MISRLNTTRVIPSVAISSLLALVIHQLAYLVVIPFVAMGDTALGSSLPGSAAGVDHGHLSVQWVVVTPLAVIAAVGFILRQVGQLGLASGIGRRRLAVLGGLMFLAQEAVEAVVQAGDASVVASHPATYAGLLLAPLVAAAFVAMLDEATELVARILAPPSVLVLVPVVQPRPSSDAPIFGVNRSGRSARGPPC